MELIQAGRFCIFFIDESQRVTLQDIGTKETIWKWALELGASVDEMVLSSQFRCNGSDGYLAWLDSTLQVRPTANPILEEDEFDFRVFDSPTDLKRLIEEKNRSRNRARLVAGYCWEWRSKRNRAEYDIELPEHGFRARWNLVADGGLWMVAKDSVSEVGCIHTAQGLEVDYIGVIVGDDLIVRDGKVVTRPEKRARSDRSIRGLSTLAKQDPVFAQSQADSIIKNTYRTLMTRGMKGCYVYCTDQETAAHFRSFLRSGPAPVERVDDVTPMSLGRAAANDIPFKVFRRSEVQPYRNALPVVPLKLAAGMFTSQVFDQELDVWAKPEDVRVAPGMFIAQVVGESMNKKIPNGSWCVFRANPGGSRQGKIVLVQHRDISDPDTGGSFTVKQYSSEKAAADDSWTHERIVLTPMSTEARFVPIVLEPAPGGDLTVVAELIAILM